MVLNFVLPTIMVIEGIMMAVQGYAFAYNKNHFYGRIDEIYLGASATYFLFSIAWILHFRRHKQPFNLWSRLARGVQGFLMIALGSLMIQSAKLIEISNNCASFEITYTEECQRFEAKMVAGILALIVSIFYLLPPVKPVALSKLPLEALTSSASNHNNYSSSRDHHRDKFKNMFLIDTPPSYQSNGSFQLPTKPYNSSPKSLEILNPSGLYQYETPQQQQQQPHYTQRDSIVSIGGTHMIPRAHHNHGPRVHFNPHANSIAEL